MDAEGAPTDLAPVISSRLFVYQQSEVAEWRAPAHTAVASLKKMLKASCSEEMGQFAWQHQQAGYIEMEAGTLAGSRKFSIKSEESFRQKCWTQFFERTKRHEIQAMDTFPQYIRSLLETASKRPW